VEEKTRRKINSKNKGSSFERKLAKFFRELGFPCTTSRFSSKEMDDKKVDLCGLPINLQAKAVEKLGCMHTILASMPDDDKINVVFHKKNNKGTVVAMSEDDFLKIFLKLREVEFF
jgi:hypothetical protein